MLREEWTTQYDIYKFATRKDCAWYVANKFDYLTKLSEKNFAFQQFGRSSDFPKLDWSCVQLLLKRGKVKTTRVAS